MISYGYSKSGRKSYFIEGLNPTPDGKAPELYADLWFTDVEVKETTAPYRRIAKSSKAVAIAMILADAGNLGIHSEYTDAGTPPNLIVNLYEGRLNSQGEMVVGGEVDPNPPNVYRDAKGHFFVKSELLPAGSICRVVTANHQISTRVDKCGTISFSEPIKKTPTGWALDGSSVATANSSYHLDDATDKAPFCRRIYDATGNEFFRIYVPK